MRTLRNVVTGLCSTALVLTPVAAPLAATADEPWEVVPADSLRDLRGGMDLGDLVANFAIQRVVEIDGVVVARMQLVISNLDRLGNGGIPTITVSGPMAEIVQFMKTAGNVSLAGPAASAPSSVAPPPAAAPIPSAAGAAASPTISSSGNSGTVSATGTQSGSMAQMGTALANAVTTAVNATSQPSAAAASPSATGSAVNAAGAAANTSGSAASTVSSAANPGLAASNTPLQASAAPAVSAQPSSASALPGAATTKVIPIGTSGQVAVMSNLPNAAALTTAVQNEVHAAIIQTQTTISATFNSLSSLNAISLGNFIRAQVSSGGG